MSRGLGSLAGSIYFTIKDPHVVKRLVDKVISSENDSIILPFIDHPGPISAEILSRKFASLTVCEPHKDRNISFKNHVRDKYPHRRINIYADDLFQLSCENHSDKSQQRCSEIAKESLEATDQTLQQPPPHGKHVKILLPLLRSRYEVCLLRTLYYQMSLRIGLCSNHLVHYYCLMSDRQFTYLNARPRENLRYYRSSTILFNTIFNIHQLDSFDLKSTFQIKLRNIQRTAGSNESKYKQVHALWLEPRLDILDRLSSRSLVEFRFFVNQLMQKRTSFVVVCLKKWFEICDDDITQFGITNSTRSGDLDRAKFIELFLYLKDQPYYTNSSFLQAAACAEDNIFT